MGKSAQWSCQAIPDFYTDVIIDPNAVVVINSNVTINTVDVHSNVNLAVNPGYNLTILH